MKGLTTVNQQPDTVCVCMFADGHEENYMLDLSQKKWLKRKQNQIQHPKTSSKEVIEKVSEQLLCSVCQKEYSKPRVLPCLHNDYVYVSDTGNRRVQVFK